METHEKRRKRGKNETAGRRLKFKIKKKARLLGEQRTRLKKKDDRAEEEREEDIVKGIRQVKGVRSLG